jgi:hypothetical protein
MNIQQPTPNIQWTNEEMNIQPRHSDPSKRPGTTTSVSSSFFGNWILNAERVLASMEKTGEALNHMAEGNVGCWILEQGRQSASGRAIRSSPPRGG